MKPSNRAFINTVIQYISLLINVLLGLISVRIILDALGASDYGIYDVIGGVIGLLSFVSASLSQTSLRYLSVSLGQNNAETTRYTFRTCFWLHLYMSIVLVAILSIFGIFLFDGFLNIPKSRLLSAKIVYMCMLLSLFLRICATPFSALITANEHFWYTSTIGIIDSILKLVVAIVVKAYMGDKLFVYGILMVFITFLNSILYLLYCNKQYKSIIEFKKVPFLAMRNISGFAGWTLLDVLSSIVNRQGYAILLNKFFGPTVNASFALSRQLEGHVYTISASAINSMKPQIMKSQGAGDSNRVYRLSITAGKMGFFLMSFITIPLVVLMPDILSLWLKQIPIGTVEFARLLIIACMAEQLTKGLFYANQAVGNIKWFSIVVSSIRMLALPTSVFFLLLGFNATTAILIFLVFETIGSICRVYLLSIITEFKTSMFIQSFVYNVLPPTIVTLFSCCIFYFFIKEHISIVGIFLVTAGINAVSIYFWGLTKEEKQYFQDLNNTFTRKLQSIAREIIG